MFNPGTSNVPPAALTGSMRDFRVPTGPDLLGVTTTRSSEWLSRFIAVPDKMLAEKDPLATALFARYKGLPMPNLSLPKADVAVLIDYIDAQTAAFAPKAAEK